MRRLLTGIQSSGKPHLGNIVGAIIPALEMAEAEKTTPFYFIADLHSQTTITDADERRLNTLSVAATWFAFGANKENTTLYRQSQIPQVCELSWYLSCFTATGLLTRAHAYREKVEAGQTPKAGLMFYPVLMAADILLYDATHVPVGKDQQEHIDITRDIAKSINHVYGETFVLPEAVITASRMLPGIDGKKMSKSRQNTIDIFASDMVLRKSIMKIVTDSAGVADKKAPEECSVFALYAAIANADQVESLRQAYLAGGMGYGEAKQKLFELMVECFGEARARYHQLMSNPDTIEELLWSGEQKARLIADTKLEAVRRAVGFNQRRNGLAKRGRKLETTGV